VLRLIAYSILVGVWGSSCVTSGVFVHVHGKFGAYLCVSKSNWLNVMIFWFFYIHLGYTPQILLCWLLKCRPSTNYVWNSTGSCVTSSAFVCGEDFGHSLALFVSYVWNHQLQHCSIMSHTTLTSLISCIYVNTTNLINITRGLERLEYLNKKFWL